ncbi:MAG: sensor domain-containing diguanylate cyclase [Sphaerochaeta sp.]|nr:sensor domain-containing diguanylate cyclase [Sphaerochaeta sp.]
MGKASFPEQWLQVFAKFSLGFFVVELGSDNKVLYRGGKASTYFGYPVEEFIKKIEGSFADFVPESEQPRVAKAIHEAKEAKADIDLRFPLICLDRSVCLVHISGTYLYSHQEIPTYLFMISEENQGIPLFERNLGCFKLCFSVATGALVEANLQGRVAFRVHEFSNLYDAIANFATQYVHPQDRRAFVAFADLKTLSSSISSKGDHMEIPFRRMSYNEVFTGYRWALLSYTLEEGSEGQGMACDLSIQDSDYIASKLAEKTLQTQLDPLTGILNRTALETHVTQQIALCSYKHTIGAFFMLDIDYFKWVNDTFGHDHGDAVLRQVTNSLRGVFRPSDIIARPGGDEFAVFITDIPSVELAMKKAENICNAMRSLGMPEDDMHLSCSVGVSIFPDHGTSFEELYHTADLALYQAKREGKDRYCLYGEGSVPHRTHKPINREWLFSQMGEEIYLCNVDTSELLFVNDSMLKRLGLTALPEKGCCYEVLHGRNTPCADCINLHASKEKVRNHIRKEPESNTVFLVREKALLLNGWRVKLSISTPLLPAWIDSLREYFSSDSSERSPRL